MTLSKKKYCNGYVLAGGKSSRMGEDKGLMLFNGQPVVQYVIDALSPAVDKVIIVSNNPAYETFGLEVIKDEIKAIGPAGGIYTALKHTDTECNFVIGCDLPFVKKEAIAFLVNHSSESQIILPVHNGQLEPLFGVYRKECLTEWQRLINDGLYKLHELVRYFKLEELNVVGNAVFGEKVFMNINTREEFDSALRQK